MTQASSEQSFPVGPFRVGQGEGLFLIAGPCVIESEEHCLELAGRLKEITAKLHVNWIFKASFDKANRTSIDSYRGPGLERGLEVLARVKGELGVPVISDVHAPGQVEAAARVLDVLQIPAFLCRQTDLIVAAAASGRPINVKKGQFLAPWDTRNILGKAAAAGCSRVMLTERGASFGYNNLVVDFKGLPMMRELGALVVFDATHSVQLPGGAGSSSGGQSGYVPALARAAVAVGVDGLFMEVHDDPASALSDGPNALELEKLPAVLEQILAIDALVRRSSDGSLQ